MISNVSIPNLSSEIIQVEVAVVVNTFPGILSILTDPVFITIQVRDGKFRRIGIETIVTCCVLVGCLSTIGVAVPVQLNV